MGKSLIYNAIRTPDGTILNSKHRHDYIEHLDKNGEIYVIDGGLDYIRTSVNKIPAESLVLYDNEPFKVIREHIYRGTRGKDGNGSLEYIKLKDISDEYLTNIITYDEEFNPNNNLLKYYKREKKFRAKSKGL